MRPLLLAVALISALAVPSAGAAEGLNRVVVPHGQPVQIAFADDLTGSASSFGTSIANAIRMAVEAHPRVHGFPVQINVVDAPCGDAAVDVAAASTIAANAQNVGVLGQLCSSGFDQALPIYESAGLVTISGSATGPSLPSFGPTVFNRTVVSDTCCPYVDASDPWAAEVAALPGDLAWQQSYTSEFGAPPTEFADLYYDAAGLLLRNLQRVAKVDDQALVVDKAALALAIRGTTNYEGVSCRITLDPATGNRVNDPAALARCG
jgi:ABC-type branched-subunit amino acid transport system substrate-binding protein